MRDARPKLHTLSHRTPGTPSPSRATETPGGASCPPHFFISVKKAHGFPGVFIEISVGISGLTSRTESLYTRGSSERIKLLCVESCPINGVTGNWPERPKLTWR